MSIDPMQGAHVALELQWGRPGAIRRGGGPGRSKNRPIKSKFT